MIVNLNGVLSKVQATNASIEEAVKLSPAVDVTKKTVRSLSGEVALDWGAGVLRVNTPRCKAAAGFLGDAASFARGARRP